MSNTVFQIRRSNTSASPGTVLAGGELAYSYSSNAVWVGAQTGVGGTSFKIGGSKYIYVDQAGVPGVQTANAVPILDGNSYYSNVFTQGLAVQATSSIAPTVFISSLTNVGNSTQLGANASGGGISTEMATTSAIVGYVSTHSGGGTPGGANTQVQFNDSAAFGGTAGFVFNKTTNTLSLGNSTVVSSLNSTAWSGSTLSSNVTAAGANLYVNTTNTYVVSNTTLAGTNTVISSNLTVTSGLIAATSANMTIQNMSVSGNLIVSGTVTTINTAELVVNAHFIQLGDLNTATDTIDEGFFGTTGNSSSTYYPGIFRIASLSTLTNPLFYVFTTKNNPNTASTLDLSVANTFTGTLQSYLAPYGSGGAFIANSTVINITANGTLSSALVANSLTLTTALGAGSGGTGQEGGYTAGDILYASGATALSKLAVGAVNGYVMQVTGNLPAWGTLDGGTF